MDFGWFYSCRIAGLFSSLIYKYLMIPVRIKVILDIGRLVYRLFALSFMS